MKLFIDTANVEEIRAAEAMGVISGVTTNPSLIAKEGRDFVTVVKEITHIVDGSVSAEVISQEAEGMIREAEVLIDQIRNPHLTIKIPMTPEGLKAVKELSQRGIKTNVTLIFSAAQALLAAQAGADYVSPFLGRLDDAGQSGLALLRQIVEIFRMHALDTKVIAASIRSPLHVIEAAQIGADIATVPYKILMQMMKHPLTDAGITRFLKDWESVKEK